MFPEELLNQLPPNGMALVLKTILYLTLIYIIVFSLLLRLIIKSKLSRQQGNYVAPATQRVSMLSFDRDISDVLTALRVEIAGYEASLKVLEDAHQNHMISEDSYTDLKLQYMKRIEQLTEEIADYNNADIETLEQELSALDLNDESIPVAASSDELSELEALTQQLTSDSDLGLEELTPPAPPTIQAPSGPTPPSESPTPSATSTPTITPPAPPSNTSETQELPPPAPPASSTPTVAPPAPSSGATPSVVTPPTPPSATAPTPSTATPTIPPAPRPPQAQAPPMPTPPQAPDTVDLPPPAPPASPASTPEFPTTPSATTPSIPSEAKEETTEGEDDGLFAKSTSIAALRMEMLRELARLKKFMSDQQ